MILACFTFLRRFGILLLLVLPIGCDGSDGTSSTAAARPDAGSMKISLEAAEQYLVAGDLVEAEAIARRMVDSAPDSLDSHELLGRVLIAWAIRLRDSGMAKAAREQWTEASEQYEQVVRLAPESSGLHQSAGEVAQMAGRGGLAVELYRRAGELDPSDPRPALYVAQLLVADGDTVAAREWIDRVLALVPEQGHALATLAVIEMEEGRWDEAKASVARAIVSQPDDLGIRTMQTRIHRRSGDPERGLELLLGLPDSSRATEAVTEEIATCWLELDRPEQAATAWERCDGASGPRAGFIALRAAEAWLAADRPIEAQAWIEQAELAGVPREQLEALGDRLVP